MTCSRNVVITPDVSLVDAIRKDYDVVVLPGGLKGAEHLAAVSIALFKLLRILASKTVVQFYNTLTLIFISYLFCMIH